MAPISSFSFPNMFTVRLFQMYMLGLLYVSHAQLSENFYSTSCPKALSIIESGVKSAIAKEARMGASLLRLHFHDCVIGGCDASILLDDTKTLIGEKTALPNLNSARGFEVIDQIKAQVEDACPGVMSCADLLTVVARDSVVGLGGPSWTVPLGRRDSTKADKATADAAHCFFFFATIIGGHTVGMAKCRFYKKRIHESNSTIDPNFAASLQANCPSEGGDNNISPIDHKTPLVFDNAYYTNLVNLKGLLPSDQQLYTGKGGPTDELVTTYSSNKDKFFEEFSKAIVKMGQLNIVTGNDGEIRTDCRKVNSGTERTEL
ncbi:Cationic peroxidase 1 [Bienertia sinuspersici]